MADTSEIGLYQDPINQHYTHWYSLSQMVVSKEMAEQHGAEVAAARKKYYEIVWSIAVMLSRKFGGDQNGYFNAIINGETIYDIARDLEPIPGYDPYAEDDVPMPADLLDDSPAPADDLPTP